ncbi:MAG: hypothetical protein LBE12_07620 [Planctomycetaceae bacterium]|jgi:hypothetical protein|nr:hypothetical protein [Planctomycetaceae bacterium]
MDGILANSYFCSKVSDWAKVGMTYFQILVLASYLINSDSVLLYGKDVETSESPESVQIIKELITKLDADIAAIVSLEVQYRRCTVSFDNLKKFTQAEVIQYIQKLDKNAVNDLFDCFVDRFVDSDSFEQNKHSNSTQFFREKIVSRNIFRWCDKQRWEKTVHSGGFEVNGEKILDFCDFYYTDEEKYINSSQFNKDLKIGNIGNFHLLFAYLMDFLQQPDDRVDWTNPSVTIDNKNLNVLTIESGDWTHCVDRERAILLQSVKIHNGIVCEQIFPFDFFSPVKNVWFPRTVLKITYLPRNVLDKSYDGEAWQPYFIYFHTIEDIKINEPISDSLFYVPALRGTVIWDYRRDLNNPFIVQANEDVVDVLSWVDSQNPPYTLPVPSKRNIYFIVTINVVIIIFFVVLFRYARQKKG